MEKIRIFVENMFLDLPDTQPVRDAKAHLMEGMTDRYEALLAQGKDPDAAFGAAVAEFGSMEEIRRELGVSSAAAPVEAAKEAPPFWDEATLREYRAFRKRFPIAIAVGVMLCILGAAISPMLANVQGLPEEVSVMIMLCIMAVGVFIFVYFGIMNSRFNQELFPNGRSGSGDRNDDDPLGGAIMLGATCLYLFLGFTMDLWHPGWIVFPAGAAICLLAKVFWTGRRR